MGLISCTGTKKVADPNISVFKVTDYQVLANWAALPQHEDPSDEVPAPLSGIYIKDSSVDVFFIHPTTYTGKLNGRWMADLNDEKLNTKTDESSIRYQASVFNEFNVYAPRYQQAHIQSFYTEEKQRGEAAQKAAYKDVRSAFLYYLENWNNGKPIILAAHSQGALHAKYLLREFFEGKPLQEKLVAAYIIGLQVEPGFFSQLPLCEDSLQTGCYLGWRTFRRDFEPDYDSSFRKSVVVNPLNWKADTSYAPVQLHKGAILRNFNKVYYKVSDAQVHEDLLWISRPKFPGSRLYKSRNYHIGDINLFYLNIRENLRARVRAFKNKNTEG
nr:DUF3089 domain-containing protein [Flavihumibacter fluminis]